MSVITVIGTVHEEIGQANATELQKILGYIQPDVLFLEVPTEAFRDFHEICSQQNLESKATTRYRVNHSVDLIPVDAPTPSGEFFSSFESLRQITRNENPEYRRLMQLDTERISRYGFTYLNSKYCSQHWSAVHDEMLNTIRRINDPKMVEALDLWNETSDRREKVMIERIQSYCRDNTMEKGAFLVGAAHLKGIFEISRQVTAGASGYIRWNFADEESGVLTVNFA